MLKAFLHMCLKIRVCFHAGGSRRNTSSKSHQKQQEFDHRAEDSGVASGGVRRGCGCLCGLGWAGKGCSAWGKQEVQAGLWELLLHNSLLLQTSPRCWCAQRCPRSCTHPASSTDSKHSVTFLGVISDVFYAFQILPVDNLRACAI